MTRTRKPSLRTCVSCGRNTDKRELRRIVRTKSGDVHVDTTGKAAGRGAYVCPVSGCFENAIQKGRLTGALRVRLTEEDVERLRDDFERLL